MQLHVLEQGYIEAVDADFVAKGGEPELVTATWPVRCYLVEHPAGWLLWDTGLPEAKLLNDPWAVGEWKKVISAQLAPWLATFGLAPQNLAYLGFSHLHIDHAGNANQFVGVPVLLGAREHDLAFGPEAHVAYYPEDYADVRQNTMILVGESHDIFGDGTAVIHAAPGHTPGHQVLALSIPDRQPVILVGDVLYSPADLTHRRVPKWNVDRDESFRSIDRVERLAKDLQAKLLIHHDPLA